MDVLQDIFIFIGITIGTLKTVTLKLLTILFDVFVKMYNCAWLPKGIFQKLLQIE